MEYSNRRRRYAWKVCALLALVIGLPLLSKPTLAATPESPEVKAMIKRGLGFLETTRDARLGGKCLVALAFLKEAYPNRIEQVKKHPKIIEAVEACREAARTNPSLKDVQDQVYSLGIAIIFLCELDADEHRKEIDALLDGLESVQKPFGAWGYPNYTTGDTSMTQYGILSAWTAKQKKIPVNQEKLEKAIDWLLRTQQPNGAFGYQAVDPGNYNGVQQQGVTLSMSAAGTGSVLMCADVLGLIQVRAQAAEAGVPSALNLVNIAGPAEADPKQKISTKVDGGRVRSAIGRGNDWFGNNYKIDWKPHTHYYLYSLERYKSFLELANNKPQRKGQDGPKWYNDGVKLLKETQKEDGSWKSKDGYPIDTSFAVLFLLRSTQKSIGKRVPMGGLLSGGRGNLDATGADGTATVDPITASTRDLLQILNDPNHPDHERILANQKNVFIASGEPIDEEQALRLRQLISGGEPKVRQAAVKALARTRDLEHVPTLIYALTDPDWNVVIEARDGLRFLSRKFAGYGIPASPDNERREVAIRGWKKWYSTIRPDAVFLD